MESNDLHGSDAGEAYVAYMPLFVVSTFLWSLYGDSSVNYQWRRESIEEVIVRCVCHRIPFGNIRVDFLCL